MSRPDSEGAGGVEVVDLGRTDFDTADAAQRRALERRASGGPDTLVLAELEPVVTLGRGTTDEAIVEPGRFPQRTVERGGEATLHLPGQLVVYPVFRLVDHDLRAWLRRLEAMVVGILGRFGIEGKTIEGLTGVWVATEYGDCKIASIGVAVRRWVSYHGFAINVDPDLDAFGAIRPCGLEASVMTSMARIHGAAPSMNEVARVAVEFALAGRSQEGVSSGT